VYQFLKTPVTYLSQMIANAWAWAASKGKVYTHPVNKAEYIDIDVDSCREKQTKSESTIAAESGFSMEDCMSSFIWL